MFLLTLLGVLMVIGAIAMLIIYPMLQKERKEVEVTNPFGEKTKEIVEPSHPMLLWFNRKRSALMLFVGIIFIGFNGMWFYAEPGVNYMVQYPWGGQKAVTTAGFSTKFWGRTIPFQNEIVFKYVLPDENGNLPQNSSHAMVEKAQQWEFNDAIKGDIAASIIIGVNVPDNDTFIKMAIKNKSERNLVYSRILPSINAALKNSAKLMSAQEYLVGRSSDFDYFFRDQLEHGLYRLEEELIEEEGTVIGDTLAIRTVGGEDKQPMKKIYVIMEDNLGQPIRQLGNDGQTVFKQYNLSIVDAIAEKVDWEEKFDTRLDKQKELVAQVQAEKQEAEKEFYRAKKEEQTGEANKIKRQKELELEQIEKTVAAETLAKSAKFKKEEEDNLYAAAQIKAKRIRVAADADAYEISRKVNAGITPEVRLKMELQRDVDVAKEIAKLQLPSTVVLSDGKGGDGLLSTLLGAELAKTMMPKVQGK